MLKLAYQIGQQQALEEENIDRLVKEAQELGIDLSKLGMPGLAAMGKGLMSGAKALGSGVRSGASGIVAGAKSGLTNTKGFGLANRATLAAKGAGSGAANAWKNMSGLQKKMLAGTGVAGATAV